MFRLPDGTLTPNGLARDAAWHALASPIVVRMNALLIAYDPYLVLQIDGETLYLTVTMARRLGDALSHAADAPTCRAPLPLAPIGRSRRSPTPTEDSHD